MQKKLYTRCYFVWFSLHLLSCEALFLRHRRIVTLLCLIFFPVDTQLVGQAVAEVGRLVVG